MTRPARATHRVRLTILGNREDFLLDTITLRMMRLRRNQRLHHYLHRSSFTSPDSLIEFIDQVMVTDGRELRKTISDVDIVGHSSGSVGVKMGDEDQPAIRLSRSGKLEGEDCLRAVLELARPDVKVRVLVCQGTKLRLALKRRLEETIRKVQPRAALYLSEALVYPDDFDSRGFHGAVSRFTPRQARSAGRSQN